jgi:hypothetical protein
LKEDASFGCFGPIPIVKGDFFTEKQGLDKVHRQTQLAALTLVADL